MNKTSQIITLILFIITHNLSHGQGQGNMFGNANNWSQLGNQGWTRSNASIVTFNNGVLEIARNNNTENTQGPIQLVQTGNSIQFRSSISNGANGNNFHFTIQILDTNQNEHFSQTLSGRNPIENGGANHVFFIDSLPYSGEYIIRFTYTGTAAGNSPATLFIENASYSLMPVQYQYIKAQIQYQNQILIQWATLSEENNLEFRIQKNIRGEWTQIGTVEGNLNSYEINHYEFTDNQIQVGKNQYRIVQIDTDGKSQTSEILEVYANPSNKKIQAYPNPTQGIIQLSGVTTPQVEIRNQIGNVVKTFTSQETITIQDLPNGIYYLLVTDLHNPSESQTLIIQKY